MRAPRGSVRRALLAHTGRDATWLLTCNWATMMLMVLTAWQLLPLQQQEAVRWGVIGSVYSFAVLLILRWVRNTSTATLERIYAAMVCGFSLLWTAVPVLFFDPQNFAFSMFMLTFLGGLAAAAVPVLAAWLPLYWIWVVPPFVAQIALYWWRGASLLYWSIGLGMLILLFSQLVFARNYRRTVISALRLGIENSLLVEQLNEKTEVAEAANRAKTMFLAAASHDLRQPVYALTLFLDALATSSLNPTQRTMVQNARAANSASSDMLRTLLDFSRVEAGVLNPKPHPMALASVLQKIEAEFGPEAFKKGVLYRTRDTRLWINSDAQLIALVLRNLVSNALRYTEQGGVLVAVRTRKASLSIQVWDTGIGIPADKHAEVFKEFHQLGNAERDHRKGLGMGLYIAAGLAKSLGGTIRIASTPGRGSVFSLVLPAPLEHPFVLEASAVLGRMHTNEPPITSLVGIRVLAVDDDEAVRESMRIVMQGWGCHVTLAAGREEALAHAQTESPDILVTDYRLRGGVTGGDLIDAVRQMLMRPDGTPRPPLPVIIVTGDTHPDRLREAQGHAALLLHKPINANTLKEALIEVLSQPGPHAV